MKKTILLGIVALAAGVATSYGQGFITLDNYLGGGTLVTYGDNATPANGISGPVGGMGSPVGATGWTVGLYFVGGTSGLVEAAGSGLPSATLALGTGTGSTTTIGGPEVFGTPGYYNSGPAFNSGSTANATVTLEVVVYDTAGGSYASALYRGHSAAFSMGTVAATSGSPAFTGAAMPGSITVTQVPEPATMALGGLGLAALMLVRRKKA